MMKYISVEIPFWEVVNMKQRTNLILMLVVILCMLSGCNQETKAPVKPKDTKAEVLSDYKESKIQLTWLTSKAWVEGLSKEAKIAINKRIQELGYDFGVKIVGVNDEDAVKYHKQIDKYKRKKQGDLIWTGCGQAEYKPDKLVNFDDTYYFEINKGNLLDISSWLKTEEGSKLYNAYEKMDWEKIQYHGKIYGYPNRLETGSTSSLYMSEGLAARLTNTWKDKEKISPSDMCQWLTEYSQETNPSFYLECIDDDKEGNNGFLGYDIVKQGIYLDESNHFVNVWEKELTRKLWNAVATIAQKGGLIYDNQQGRTAIEDGTVEASIHFGGASLHSKDLLVLDNGKVRKGKNIYITIIQKNE